MSTTTTIPTSITTISDSQWEFITRKLSSARLKDFSIKRIVYGKDHGYWELINVRDMSKNALSLLFEACLKPKSIIYDKGKPSYIAGNIKILFSIGSNSAGLPFFEDKDLNIYPEFLNLFSAITDDVVTRALFSESIESNLQKSLVFLKDLPRKYIHYFEEGLVPFDEKSSSHLGSVLENHRNKWSTIQSVHLKISNAKAELRTLLQELEDLGIGDEDDLQKNIENLGDKLKIIQDAEILEKKKKQYAELVARHEQEVETAKNNLFEKEKALKEAQKQLTGCQSVNT